MPRILILLIDIIVLFIWSELMMSGVEKKDKPLIWVSSLMISVIIISLILNRPQEGKTNG